MGLKLKQQKEEEKPELESLSVGTIAILESGSVVIRVNSQGLQTELYGDEVYAVNLEDGDVVLNPKMRVDKVFGEGDKVTFEIRD
jgi:translation initiation factor IF-1